MVAKASTKSKTTTAKSKQVAKAKPAAKRKVPVKAKPAAKAKTKPVAKSKPAVKANTAIKAKVKAKGAAKPVKKAGSVKNKVQPKAKVPAKAPTGKPAVAKLAQPAVERALAKPAKVEKPAKPSGVIIRTGPSIAPRNLGKSPLSALRGAPVKKHTEKAKPLTEKEIAQHRDLLLKLRDRVIDEISFLANDNLNKSAKDASGDLSSYSFHMADQGTDNFDREFAASLLNSEHDVLYEIDEALRRIEQGTYGICEQSGEPIERDRLKALPFARFCMSVQVEMERGKPKFRPFRRVSIQSSETT